METERRHEIRSQSRAIFSLSWKDAAGITRSAEAQALNTSHSGLAFRCPVELPLQTVVYVEAQEAFTPGYSLVRHCNRQGDSYTVGVELDEIAKQASLDAGAESQNYYDFLQISPRAQAGTIHRVFRYLAGRYHPDNPETSDPERFLLLNRAYKVLSDPKRRAAYDEELNRTFDRPSSTFAGIDFLDGVEGELNRRLAVLVVLYRKCRANINDARVSLLELEAEMGFPREFLDFTTWYLRSKKYITREDNSDFSLTVVGVDFVEENCEKLPLLRKLLSGGTPPDFRRKCTQEGSEADSRRETPLILPAKSEPANGKLFPGEIPSELM